MYETILSTPGYVSPENLSNRKLKGKDLKAADMWSLGVVLFIMLCGHFPVDGDTEEEELENTVEGNISWGSLEGIPEPTLNLVQRILHMNLKKRYTAKEVLNHLDDIDESAAVFADQHQDDLAQYQ